MVARSRSSSAKPTPLALTTTSARRGASHCGAQALIRGRIHHHLAPSWWCYVSMALAIQDVRLIERDIVAIGGECLQQAAIISRSAVPVATTTGSSRRRRSSFCCLPQCCRLAHRRSTARGNDRQQFIHAVRAGVALRMVSRPLAANDCAKCIVLQQQFQLCGHVRHRCAASRKSPLRNSASSSCQGAQTRGMPHANASNTRIVGMPGSASTYGRRGTCTVTRWRANSVRDVHVGDPAAIVQRGAAQGGERRVRVANAAHRSGQFAGVVLVRSGIHRVPVHVRHHPSCRSTPDRAGSVSTTRGRNRRVSAASCQVNTWRPHPRLR